MRKDTNTTAAVTESRFLAACLAAGYGVAIPFGVKHYDLVVEVNGNLQRVQCKTGRLRKGAIMFNGYSVVRVAGKYKNRPYLDSIDYYGVYCPELDKCYLVPASNHLSTITLRVDDPHIEGNHSKIRMAAQFEI